MSLDDFNLTGEQTLLTIGIWQASDVVILGSLWAACYRRSPTNMIRQYPLFKTKIDKMLIKYPKIVEKAHKIKARVDNNTYVKKYSDKL